MSCSAEYSSTNINIIDDSGSCVSDVLVFNPFDLNNDNITIYNEYFDPDNNLDN